MSHSSFRNSSNTKTAQSARPIAARRRVLVAAAAASALGACGGSGGGAAVPVTPPAVQTTLPMTVRGNHVAIALEVNGTRLTFMIDTGADINLITQRTADALGLAPLGPPVRGSGAGGEVVVTPVLLQSMQVGALKLANQPAYSVSMPEEFVYDGVLGAPFLALFGTRMDYARGQATLTAFPHFVAPAGVAAVPIQLRGAKLLVFASVAGVQDWFQVDSGSTKAAVVHTPTVAQFNLRERLVPAVRMVTGGGGGGRTMGDIVRAPEVVLGDHRWSNVPVELSLQTTGSFANASIPGHLGGEIWRRFTITLDYAAQRMYLEPNNGYAQPFAGPRGGLALGVEQGVVKVFDVVPGSPADQAQLQVRDTLVAVNGTAANAQTLYDIQDLLKSVPGTALDLSVMNTQGVQRDARLVLRDLL